MPHLAHPPYRRGRVAPTVRGVPDGNPLNGLDRWVGGLVLSRGRERRDGTAERSVGSSEAGT